MKVLKNIKGIVFDWAGTLIDYGCLAPTAVFVEVFKKNGIEISMQEARGPMGIAKKDHVRELLKLDTVASQWDHVYGRGVTEEDVVKLYSQLTPALIDIIPQYAAVIPGVKELFSELRNSNIKIGSSTGYVTEMMASVVSAASKQGILPDSVVASDEVPEGRPAPFMIYRNALNLGVFPIHEMIKVGDTVADVKEGLNAGMWVVGYTKCGNEVGYSEEEIINVPEDELTARIKQAEEKLRTAGAHFVVEGPWELMTVLNEIDYLLEKGINPIEYIQHEPAR